MRNLRKIFEAFGLINANPVASIKSAFSRLLGTVAIVGEVEQALTHLEDEKYTADEFIDAVRLSMHAPVAKPDDIAMLTKVIKAVVDIAEEDAVKASKKGG